MRKNWQIIRRFSAKYLALSRNALPKMSRITSIKGMDVRHKGIRTYVYKGYVMRDLFKSMSESMPSRFTFLIECASYNSSPILFSTFFFLRYKKTKIATTSTRSAINNVCDITSKI